MKVCNAGNMKSAPPKISGLIVLQKFFRYATVSQAGPIAADGSTNQIQNLLVGNKGGYV